MQYLSRRCSICHVMAMQTHYAWTFVGSVSAAVQESDAEPINLHTAAQQARHQFIGSKVVEVGAGLGLVGLYLAKLGAQARKLQCKHPQCKTFDRADDRPSVGIRDSRV